MSNIFFEVCLKILYYTVNLKEHSADVMAELMEIAEGSTDYELESDAATSFLSDFNMTLPDICNTFNGSILQELQNLTEGFNLVEACTNHQHIPSITMINIYIMFRPTKSRVFGKPIFWVKSLYF